MESEEDRNVVNVRLSESLLAAEERERFWRKVWIESKQLWKIVGPSIFSRVAMYTMNVVTQAFAGHLGDVDLAAISIANNVIVGFNFGLLLGMASALETLCGQAFGANKYDMLGIYMQRCWIVQFLCCFLLLPFYILATPILKLLGQSDDVAEQCGVVSLWLIPLHFSFAFQFPLLRFLQCQGKAWVMAWVSVVGLVVNVLSCYVLVYVWDLGLVGAAISLDISWWLLVLAGYGYMVCGGCPLTWTGYSMQAFSGLWDFFKLSAASGIMLCLENWYYRILILMTGHWKDATIVVDALSICMTISGWEMMIPLAFFAGAGVANELGGGNGKGAKFATQVSVGESTVIGALFCLIIILFCDQFAYIFTSTSDVVQVVHQMAYLLALTILFNSVQPVLSGVAVGLGWQARVAYINIGCYYIIGLPLGILMGWVFNLGVKGMWGGMILGGTAIQTAILVIITARCDWDKEHPTVGTDRGNRFAPTQPGGTGINSPASPSRNGLYLSWRLRKSLDNNPRPWKPSRVIGEEVPESEGSSGDDVVKGEKALEGDGGTARAVKSVHERVYAGTRKKVGTMADGEDGDDSGFRWRGGEGVSGGAEDGDANGRRVAFGGESGCDY
ncbi:protein DETOXIFICATION 27-like [Senna tora]|uniref:Protein DETOXIFICATION n=1 Tax=Senna tora TaxID=362788 RepID=A0A834WPM9_9FABA|nr:protein DETOXIFICATION 27-like [Senna tora]